MLMHQFPFEDFFQLSARPQARRNSRQDRTEPYPRADIVNADDAIHIHLEVPGMEQDEIDIEFDRGRLKVSGTKTSNDATYRETFFGEFEREFSIPNSIDPAQATADLKLGLLTITLPKREESLPKKIAIGRIDEAD